MIRFIEKSEADGTVCAPGSKSAAHRLLICAAMCQGVSRIDNIPLCDDVLATIDCLKALGVGIELNGCSATIHGIDLTKAEPKEPLNCRESGSTLRFLIPIAMLSGKEIVFVGSKKLLSRPMTIYETLAKEYSLSFKKHEDGISVRGPLGAGEYFIDGSVSSQFITGMLLALSTLSGDSRIIINKRLESEPYVNMTIDAMSKFGIRVYREDDYSFFTFGGQEYRAGEMAIEGDWSAAAFLFALDSISADGCVTVNGLDIESLQGDKICKEHLKSLERGCAEIDISDCPDLGPILFTVAAIKQGGRFTGTKRLRDKESDRIASMQQELAKFGAELIAEENAVTVLERELHSPSERLCGHNDHRIVMSLAVISTLFGGEIDGCEAVAKSYPRFFEDIKALGIQANEIN